MICKQVTSLLYYHQRISQSSINEVMRTVFFLRSIEAHNWSQRRLLDLRREALDRVSTSRVELGYALYPYDDKAGTLTFRDSQIVQLYNKVRSSRPKRERTISLILS